MSNKLELMPGIRLSPEFLLRRMLERVDEIEEIAFVVHWKTDEFEVCNSAVTNTQLIMMGAYLSRVAMDEFVKGTPNE